MLPREKSSVRAEKLRKLGKKLGKGARGGELWAPLTRLHSCTVKPHQGATIGNLQMQMKKCDPCQMRQMAHRQV